MKKPGNVRAVPLGWDLAFCDAVSCPFSFLNPALSEQPGLPLLEVENGFPLPDKARDARRSMKFICRSVMCACHAEVRVAKAPPGKYIMDCRAVKRRSGVFLPFFTGTAHFPSGQSMPF